MKNVGTNEELQTLTTKIKLSEFATKITLSNDPRNL